MHPDRLDTARTGVLATMERAERNMKLGIFGAALAELALIALVVFAFDLSNRTERLIFITSILSYSIIALGLVALGAHVTRTVGRLATLLDAERGSR